MNTPTVDDVVAARALRRRRVAVVDLTLAAVLAGAVLLALSVGSSYISLPDVLSTLAGQGSRHTDFAILETRLPRTCAGLLVGLAFGRSGALLQTLLNNPLASPDVVGISVGASAAAVSAIVLFGLGGLAVSAFALVGALATAAVMYLLAWRDGVSGYRLVLVGIGLAALLLSVVSYLMTRAQVATAADALFWLTGSLNGRGWADVVPLAVGVAVLVPVTAVLSRVLSVIRFGDDLARGLGVPVERARLGLLLCAVALAGVATAAAGPVAFVALLAAPIGRGLARDGSPALLPSALVGGLIVVVADFVAQQLPSASQFPVGVLTGAIGAPYLLVLLARMNASGRGG